MVFRDLEERDHWAFVRDYRRTTACWLVPKSLRLSSAIKKIEEEHMKSHPQLNEILKAADGSGFLLAVVAGA
jgi:hypothetical protein